MNGALKSSELKKKFVIYSLNPFVLCPPASTKMSADAHVKVSRGGVNLCFKNKHYMQSAVPVFHRRTGATRHSYRFFSYHSHLSHNTFYRLNRVHLFTY